MTPQVIANCAKCGEAIYSLPPPSAHDLPDEWPDTLQTSIFVGEVELRYHWRCYEETQQLEFAL